MNIEARKSLLEALREHLDSGMFEYCGYELSSSQALIVIDLLRFSIPVVPTHDHRYAELGCPCCGNMVSGWEEMPNYCPYCGQKIDWKD